MIDERDRLMGMLVGLAVGDAMGVPAEFKDPGTFEPIAGMRGGGVFALPLGAWTDDTSMALCIADSLLEVGGYDSYDVMQRYGRWWRQGYRSSVGYCFDIGGQTSDAIYAFEQKPMVPSVESRTDRAGNGAIMRLAPIVIAAKSAGLDESSVMKLSKMSARETHYCYLAETATAVFGSMLYKASQSMDKSAICRFIDISGWEESDRIQSVINHVDSKDIDVLQPTGFILDTLEVALWSFMHTDSFEEGLLLTVNLGGDADTTGAVYGQLAGAYYGLREIPESWIGSLRDVDQILELADRLCGMQDLPILRTRFEEDWAV